MPAATTPAINPTRRWAAITGVAVLSVVGTLGAMRHFSAIPQHLIAQDRMERANGHPSNYCSRHDVLKNLPAIEQSIATLATRHNPDLVKEVPALVQDISAKILSSGSIPQMAQASGFYVYIPASRTNEGSADVATKYNEYIPPMQVLMQGFKDGRLQCLAFGLTGEGKLIGANPAVKHAVSIIDSSSHSEAPRCDKAAQSLMPATI